ncbi:hypothetical protein LTR84_004956 [Exophiala bonariae]|uniref:SMP-30/Gluconolactonase/LRE-like region domain-containing protein n=1 Tax=Exophiala bonariae TaxID=1690606 RepID=A0AAV9NQ20_9EURO|nr:hypothetical protein LTR84_004956 [Exophiala bonariae]
MSSIWTKLIPVAVLGLASLYNNPYPLLNRFGGRVLDLQPNNDHLGHGALNNDKCWTFPVGKASCGYPETRNVFYPPLARHDTVSAKTYREYFLKYDIKSNSTVPLVIEGLDASHDLILHGIDLFIPKDDKSRIYMFAVNHARTGSEILLFSHKIGSDVLTFVRSFKHSSIKTPNAVAATSLDSFFITNDHYFWGGFLGGVLRKFENKFGPWKWASDVVHCSAAGSRLDCKTVSPTHSHPSANGALLIDDGKVLLVNDVVKGTTTFYDVDPVSKELTVKQEVRLGAAADNLSEIPGSGDIAVCVFPDVMRLIGRLTGDNLLKTDFKGEAAVLRLVKKNNYQPEVLYWDDGSLITVLTGAAVDPVTRRLIAGGVAERHFIVCDISGVNL